MSRQTVGLLVLVVLLAAAITFVGCDGADTDPIRDPDPDPDPDPVAPTFGMMDEDNMPVTNAAAGTTPMVTAAGLAPGAQYGVTVEDPNGVAVGQWTVTANRDGELPSLPAMDLHVVGIYTVTVRDADGSVVDGWTFPVTDDPGDPPVLIIENGNEEWTTAVMAGESVYVSARRLPANTQVDLYVVEDQTQWNVGDPLNDLTDAVTTATTDNDGNLPRTLIWPAAAVANGVHEFDVIADVDQSGSFSAGDVTNAGYLTGLVVQQPMGMNPAQVPSGDGLLWQTNLASRGDRADYTSMFFDTDSIHVWINPSYRIDMGVGYHTVYVYVIVRPPNGIVVGDPLNDVTEGVNEFTLRQWCSNLAWTPGGGLVWANPTAGEYTVVVVIQSADGPIWIVDDFEVQGTDAGDVGVVID